MLTVSVYVRVRAASVWRRRERGSGLQGGAVCQQGHSASGAVLPEEAFHDAVSFMEYLSAGRDGATGEGVSGDGVTG